MTVHHEIPTRQDLRRLSEGADCAVTIYVPTVPVQSERRANQVALKSAFDAAVRQVRANGGTDEVVEALREQWRRVDEDAELWGALSGSLAVFLAPDRGEVFVLPNDLEAETQVSGRFDLGQLLRSVTYPHEAFALTLSWNGWALWHAQAGARATPLDVDGDHPEDAEAALNLDPGSGGGRKDRGRGASGDERRKRFADQYLKQVSDAVKSELNAFPGAEDVPLFVFAAEPLLSAVCAHIGRDVVRVSGAPDELGGEDIDAEIRSHLDEIHAAVAEDELAQAADQSSAGLVATDLNLIGRAAAAGAVDALFFDFSVERFGRVDESSGAVQLVPDAQRAFADGTPASNVLSELAVLVLAQGGRVFALREDEVDTPIWNGVAVARLRHALA